MSSKKLALLSSEFDEPGMYNEFDCPLFRLTNDLHVIIPVSSIIKSVSVLHSGTESCKFSLFSWNMNK